ncbi:polysaccharide biosynthesis protein [Rhodobacter sp. CZR27]|uniref:polysaccharide biosynthesis protein n=1 Tax=Rhodobacter sp. CZR27 TaxID=2033869 RepID=UPI000BBE6EE2|nr:polysaccharide biosynthesis protein [Rhodobacter sp. CZR27]
MEIILHIGMGKTGTSSIQNALRQNRERLARQGVDYLGIWFDAADRRFLGYDGQAAFFRSTPEEMRTHAGRFLDTLKRRAEASGIDRFILSNEGTFAQGTQMRPFIEDLRKHATVRLIAYVRNPREWLPSAYMQWSIYHKTYPGPIRPYAAVAPQLVRSYAAIQVWGETFSDLLTLRPFRKDVNVVADFGAQLGLAIDIPEARILERTDAGESMLRALYNNRQRDSALPHLFNAAFQGLRFPKTPRIEDLLKDSFSYDGTEAAIAENRAPFDYIRETFGIDLLADEGSPPKTPAADALRDRLLEHVLQIVMQQADRIRALEQRVEEMKPATQPPGQA